jgi:hypothetical protein
MDLYTLSEKLRKKRWISWVFFSMGIIEMSWLVESVFSNVQPLPAGIERVLSGLKYASDCPILAGMTMSFHVRSLRDAN